MRRPVWIHYELLLHIFKPDPAVMKQDMVCCSASTYCNYIKCSYQQEPLLETQRVVPWMRSSMYLARFLLSRSTDRGALTQRNNNKLYFYSTFKSSILQEYDQIKQCTNEIETDKHKIPNQNFNKLQWMSFLTIKCLFCVYICMKSKIMKRSLLW